MVVTWYLSSLFMGHTTADVVVHFENCAVGLHSDTLYQISMDGPNVNWKFFRLFKRKVEEKHNLPVINIGSYGLHIVHSAFRDGATASGWDIVKLLISLCCLFKARLLVVMTSPRLLDLLLFR